MKEAEKNITDTKYSELCELFAIIIAKQGCINEQAVKIHMYHTINKKSSCNKTYLRVYKKLYRSNSRDFDDNSTKNFTDAFWRLLNERNREIKEGFKDGAIGFFLRKDETITNLITCVEMIYWVKDILVHFASRTTVTDRIKSITDKLQKYKVKEEKNEILKTYNNYRL